MSSKTLVFFVFLIASLELGLFSNLRNSKVDEIEVDEDNSNNFIQLKDLDVLNDDKYSHIQNAYLDNENDSTDINLLEENEKLEDQAEEESEIQETEESNSDYEDEDVELDRTEEVKTPKFLEVNQHVEKQPASELLSLIQEREESKNTADTAVETITSEENQTEVNNFAEEQSEVNNTTEEQSEANNTTEENSSSESSESNQQLPEGNPEYLSPENINGETQSTNLIEETSTENTPISNSDPSELLEEKTELNDASYLPDSTPVENPEPAELLEEKSESISDNTYLAERTSTEDKPVENELIADSNNQELVQEKTEEPKLEGSPNPTHN